MAPEITALTQVLAAMTGYPPEDAAIVAVDPGDYDVGLPTIAEFAAKIEAALRARGLAIMEPPESPWARQERERQQRKAARAAEAARQMAAAVAYGGAIRWCQASVHDEGRLAVGFHRCPKAPKWVVRRDERPVKGTEQPHDGRLAVCLAHARDPQSGRYHAHWSHERTAGEPVEPEYQPAVPA